MTRQERPVARVDRPAAQTTASGVARRDVSVVQSTTYSSGPLPNPQTLADFDRALPGSAERIFVSFENEGAQRRLLDRMKVEADIRRAAEGLYCGTGVAVLALVAAVVLGLSGREVAAAIIGALDIVALVAVFVYGTQRRRKDE